jgi:hypothetical protein
MTTNSNKDKNFENLINTDGVSFRRENIPTGWEPRSEWSGEEGIIISKPQTNAALTNFDEILIDFGYDPAKVEIVGNVRHSKWQGFDGEWKTAYRITIRAKVAAEQEYDLKTLFAAAKKAPAKKAQATSTDRTTVVVYSDPQFGKTGHRGGTPELLARSADCRNQLADILKARKPSATAFLDGGDGIENFHSGGNPMFTNDMSLVQQMDAYGTDVYEYLNLLQKYGHVDVLAVPSNHSAWREGKQNLGKPSDDLGLYVHRQVAKLAKTAGIDASWFFPAEYEEAVVLDVRGTKLGLTHGHQFGQGQAITWWQKQTFGGQSVTFADILVTAHYHTFGIGTAGRNPINNNQRWWFGAPTLDNGSDWYRNVAGRDSDPGILIFDIDENGIDMSSVALITPKHVI